MNQKKGLPPQLSPILVGLMGSGKSSIGRRLAAYMDLPLIDLDDYIVEQAGRLIPDIFAQDGELAFRQMETNALRDVIDKHAVIATGGGIVMTDENRQLLTSHPPVIWLKARPEFLADRIDGDSNRPLIAAGDTLKKLQRLAALRYPLYKQCADFTLPRGDMKKAEALQSIIVFLTDWQRTHSYTS
ncbi:MAG: shikimate kinase [Mariprofundus sp.]|nr:shikimate kinase [Mariprofundus sp.]